MNKKKKVMVVLLSILLIIVALLLTLNILATYPLIEYTPSKKAIRNTFSLNKGIEVDECIGYKNIQRDMGYFPHLLFQIKTKYLLVKIDNAIEFALNDYTLVEDITDLEHLKELLIYISDESQKDWIISDRLEKYKIYAKDIEPKYDTPQFMFTIENRSTIYIIMNSQNDSALLIWDQSRA